MLSRAVSCCAIVASDCGAGDGGCACDGAGDDASGAGTVGSGTGALAVVDGPDAMAGGRLRADQRFLVARQQGRVGQSAAPCTHSGAGMDDGGVTAAAAAPNDDGAAVAAVAVMPIDDGAAVAAAAIDDSVAAIMRDLALAVETPPAHELAPAAAPGTLATTAATSTTATPQTTATTTTPQTPAQAHSGDNDVDESVPPPKPLQGGSLGSTGFSTLGLSMGVLTGWTPSSTDAATFKPYRNWAASPSLFTVAGARCF